MVKVFTSYECANYYNYNKNYYFIPFHTVKKNQDLIYLISLQTSAFCIVKAKSIVCDSGIEY